MMVTISLISLDTRNVGLRKLALFLEPSLGSRGEMNVCLEIFCGKTNDRKLTIFKCIVQGHYIYS